MIAVVIVVVVLVVLYLAFQAWWPNSPFSKGMGGIISDSIERLVVVAPKTKVGGACRVGATCAGFTSLTDRVGCCDGTCQAQTRVDGLWRCPGELKKDRKDGEPCTGAQCLRCINPSTYWHGKARVTCGREPPWRDGVACAAGTSCKACKDKKSSIWTDGMVRCGVQGKTVKDGVLCLQSTTCKHCINPATKWRNGSWYCGNTERCCADTIAYNGMCLLKASLKKLGSTCTLGLIDPGDGRCHGVALHRCGSRQPGE